MVGTLIFALCVGFAGELSAAAAVSQYAPGEVLVRWSEEAAKPAPAALAALEALRARYGVIEEVPLFPASRHSRAKAARLPALSRWRLLRLKGGEDPAQVARAFAALEMVQYAQPNYLRRPARAPGDSLFAQQWSLGALGWDAGVVGRAEDVLVAVVDSGLEYDHPDIAAQVWINLAERQGEAGVDDDANGYIDDEIGWDFSDAPGLPGEGDYLERDPDPRDESGHGTHVAGIIAAVVDNGRGVAGVAPGVRLMPLRAGFNLGGAGYLQDDDIAAAMVYAVENGAQVINLSFGEPHEAPLLHDAVRYAARAGCILVAAAGNEGSDEVLFPARFDETIAVAATDRSDRVLSFSNRGPSIDVAAPGLRILSLGLGGSYSELSGTSMAAPHVSGLAALILARHPRYTAAQVRSALQLSARDLREPGWDSRSGAGLVQASAPLVEQAPGMELRAPRSGAVLNAATRVELVLSGGGFADYELSWGAGRAPGVWQVLRGGTVTGSGTFVAEWDVDQRPEGEYLLRARATWKGHSLERRAAVRVRRRAPLVGPVRLVRALDGGQWRHLVEWSADLPAGGAVRLFRAGEDEAFLEVAGEPGRRRQRVLLPADLPSGEYRVEVEAAAGQVSERVEAARLQVGARRVSRWDFAERAILPDGYLLPLARDFDGDGRPELVQMSYAGSRYNIADFYESGADFSLPEHTSSLLFIPWNVHDLDGDGRLELMAVDAQRVRLLEAPPGGGFPVRVIWEQRGVWGGEAADLDGDGRPEIFLRSATAELFRVFESVGDDAFAEIATLANPTEGGNALGERQVVADLDGDGRGELLGGDGDGDLFAYESVADNAFRPSWRQESEFEPADGRVVGGGVDLDGDGRVEFAAARLLSDPLEQRQTRWRLGVYQATGDNAFAPEWELEVLGGQPGGNGISVADLDGDGQVEMVLALVPNLYVLRALGPGEYEPVWQAPASITHRPLLGDLDGDGETELVFNSGGAVRIFGRRNLPGGLRAPTGLVAYRRGEDRVVVEWEEVPDAGAYRVFRGGEVRAARLEDTHFEEALEAGAELRYTVAALGSGAGLEGARSPAVGVERGRPAVLRVERLGPAQLGVVFSEAMSLSAREAHRFRLEPGVGAPSSVLPDRGRTRALLSFASLPDSGRFVLRLEGLRNRRRVPLAEESRQVEIELAPFAPAARVLEAEARSATEVVLRFSRPVALPAGAEKAFSFEDPRVLIRAARLEGDDAVVLELEEKAALQPTGRRYRIAIRGLRDAAGRRVDGRVSVSLAAADLEAVRVFPNPFRPARGLLRFGSVPPKAQVHIFDAAGQLVRVLNPQESGGAIQWDGRNEAGRRLHSGIYFYRVVQGEQSKVGKFALVRD